MHTLYQNTGLFLQTTVPYCQIIGNLSVALFYGSVCTTPPPSSVINEAESLGLGLDENGSTQ
jgi:hypothetical protein